MISRLGAPVLIWILMSVGLVVLVAGGFVGRARRDRHGSRAHNAAPTRRPTTARRSATAGAGAAAERGRNGGAVPARGRPGQVGWRTSSSLTLSLRISRRSSSPNSLSSIK